MILGYLRTFNLIKATIVNKLLRQNRELTLLILTHYLPVALNEMRKEVFHFFDHVEMIQSTRGTPFVVKYVKESRNAVMRYVSGEALSSGDLVTLNKRGWPIWLSKFEKFTNEPEQLKLLMTLLVSLRWISLPPVLDTSSIIEPSKSKGLSNLEITTALRLLGIGPIKTEWKSFHITVKSGPIGQALLMSQTEAALLPIKIREGIKLLGGTSLASRLSDLIEPFDILPGTASSLWSKVYSASSTCLRRISFFSDKEGKTRVIGILDYWTQSALYTLHNELNRLLRKLHCDCTFDQNKFVTLLSDKPIYYSLDLKAATDRMPITFQKEVLAKIIGDAKAQAWVDLLVSLGFAVKGSKELIYYKAGQPMGAYSSWPAMALSHHVMVQVSFLRTIPEHLWPRLRRPFKAYALLGDDLVIADKEVALFYYKVLSDLDIDYSPSKTHISENFYEFAKRVFFKGHEITGFAVGGLRSVYKSYPLLSNFLQNQESHGFILIPENFGSFVFGLYKVMKRDRYSYEHTTRIFTLLQVFIQLSKDTISGDYRPVVKLIGDLFGYRLPNVSLYDIEIACKRVISIAKKKLYEKDLQKINHSHQLVLNRLNKMVDLYVKAWPDQDQNTLNFLWETVPAMLIHNSPLLSTLTDLISAYEQALIKEDYSSLESIGLAKYFIGRSVFSMRRSESLTLANSGLVKVLISTIKTIDLESFAKELHPNIEGNSIIYL
jgi:hypothetical protein